MRWILLMCGLLLVTACYDAAEERANAIGERVGDVVGDKVTQRIENNETMINNTSMNRTDASMDTGMQYDDTTNY